MDKDRIKGAAQTLKGRIENAIGKMTGNRKLETEGKIDKAVGSLRSATGNAKDDIRAAVKGHSKR
jgi:uncharacterized protein YjbJ (UPF0337 family)